MGRRPSRICLRFRLASLPRQKWKTLINWEEPAPQIPDTVRLNECTVSASIFFGKRLRILNQW
jgi:hypothetical protein